MNMKMIWYKSTLGFARKGDQHCRVGLHHAVEEGDRVVHYQYNKQGKMDIFSYLH